MRKARDSWQKVSNPTRAWHPDLEIKGDGVMMYLRTSLVVLRRLSLVKWGRLTRWQVPGRSSKSPSRKMDGECHKMALKARPLYWLEVPIAYRGADHALSISNPFQICPWPLGNSLAR